MVRLKFVMLPLAIFLLLMVAGAGIALAEGGDEDPPIAQDHEACGILPKFNYHSGSNTLDWGTHHRTLLSRGHH